jgi:hypothetical protein
MKYIAYILLAFAALWMLATVMKGIREAFSGVFGSIFKAGITAK